MNIRSGANSDIWVYDSAHDLMILPLEGSKSEGWNLAQRLNSCPGRSLRRCKTNPCTTTPSAHEDCSCLVMTVRSRLRDRPTDRRYTGVVA